MTTMHIRCSLLLFWKLAVSQQAEKECARFCAWMNIFLYELSENHEEKKNDRKICLLSSEHWVSEKDLMEYTRHTARIAAQSGACLAYHYYHYYHRCIGYAKNDVEWSSLFEVSYMPSCHFFLNVRGVDDCGGSGFGKMLSDADKSKSVAPASQRRPHVEWAWQNDEEVIVLARRSDWKCACFSDGCCCWLVVLSSEQYVFACTLLTWLM